LIRGLILDFDVKSGWPSTIEAFSPLEKAYAPGTAITAEKRKIVMIAMLHETAKNLVLLRV